MSFSNVTNSYFKNGFIHMDEKNLKLSGCFIISSIYFMDNTSECGTFLNVPFMNENTSSLISIMGCYFANNTASKYGGVVYSMNEYNKKHIYFMFNEFGKNYAKLGDVTYGISKNAMIDIDKVKNSDIRTPPSYFKLNNTSYSSISLLSGENIPKNIIGK